MVSAGLKSVVRWAPRRSGGTLNLARGEKPGEPSKGNKGREAKRGAKPEKPSLEVCKNLGKFGFLFEILEHLRKLSIF